jgi:hypothetical protein
MKVSGRIIKLMDMDNTHIQMEHNMRAIRLMIYENLKFTYYSGV